MNRTVLFVLLVTIIANDVTGFRLLPWHATDSSAHTQSSTERSITTYAQAPHNVSDDYRKYSYLITTYL